MTESKILPHKQVLVQLNVRKDLTEHYSTFRGLTTMKSNIMYFCEFEGRLDVITSRFRYDNQCLLLFLVHVWRLFHFWWDFFFFFFYT